MNPHTLIIEPGLAERHYWRDLWRYRELCCVLAWRDLTVRYKPTHPPKIASTLWTRTKSSAAKPPARLAEPWPKV